MMDILLVENKIMKILYIVILVNNIIYYAVNYHFLFHPLLKILTKISEKLGKIRCIKSCSKKIEIMLKYCYRMMKF